MEPSKFIEKLVKSEDVYKASASDFVAEIKKTNKKYIKALFSALANTTKSLKDLKSSKEPLKHYLTLRLLKDCIDNAPENIAQELINDQTIMRNLGEIAKFDSKNPSIDRGKAIFGGKEPKIGEMYLRLVLEFIYKWNKLLKNNDETPTLFGEIYKMLVSNKVTFPKNEEFVFYNQTKKSKQQASAQMPMENKSKTPSGFAAERSGKAHLLAEKNQIQQELKSIVESFQETVFLNDEPNDFIKEILEQTIPSLKPLQDRYSKFISESFNNPDLLSEKESARLFEEQEFLSFLLEDIGFLLKKFTPEEYKRFSSKTTSSIQRIFYENTKALPNTPTPFGATVKPDSKIKNEPHSYFPSADEPRIDKTFERNSSLGQEYHFKELPKAEQFGTFGGSGFDNENEKAFGFHEFPNSGKLKNDGFDNFGSGFGQENEGFFKNDQKDEWKKHDFDNAGGFDNDSHMKSSNVESHYYSKEKKIDESSFHSKEKKIDGFTASRLEPIHESKYENREKNQKVNSRDNLQESKIQDQFSNRSGFGSSQAHNSHRNAADNKKNMNENSYFSNPYQEQTQFSTVNSKKAAHKEPIQKDDTYNNFSQNPYQDNTAYASTYQKKPKAANKLNESQKGGHGYFPAESDAFDEKFENLSVSTLSVRDFPLKNRVLKDPKRKTPGKLISFNSRLFDLEYLKENSSNLRKFKQACLKNKCPLYEIPQLQIGMLSSNFFDIPSSKNFLKIGLFYGNKTKFDFEHFSVEYTGDYSFSMWIKKSEEEFETNEAENQQTILAKSQIKHEMIISFNSIPSTIIMAEIEMKAGPERLSFPVYLPLLITKFMVLKHCDMQIFNFKWKIKKEYRLRTDVFPINPKVMRHPSYIKRYFPDCCEITSLKDFISQTKDSEYLDYKVGIIFELNKPDIEYLMKIVLRPNMTMYVQISSPPNYIEICEYVLQNIYFIFSK